jgi:hypothetical protein
MCVAAGAGGLRTKRERLLLTRLYGLAKPEFTGLSRHALVYCARPGETQATAWVDASSLRVPPKESQDKLTFIASRGSHRRAVHQHATLPLRPWLAAIALSLAFVGLAAKAIIPDLVYDDLAHLVSADPGSATACDGDGDDDGKLVPHDGLTMGKFGDFAKAILDTVDLGLPHSLMPVHALAVSDAATEPLLPDHFLPNAETGPPAGITLGATTASRAARLLGTVGAVRRSGRLPRQSLSRPQQQPTIVFAENGTTPCSFPRRSSL